MLLRILESLAVYLPSIPLIDVLLIVRCQTAVPCVWCRSTRECISSACDVPRLLQRWGTMAPSPPPRSAPDGTADTGDDNKTDSPMRAIGVLEV